VPEIALPSVPLPDTVPLPPTRKPEPPTKAEQRKETKEPPAHAKGPAPARPPAKTALAQRPLPHPPEPTKLEAPVSKSGDPYINRLRDEMKSTASIRRLPGVSALPARSASRW